MREVAEACVGTAEELQAQIATVSTKFLDNFYL